MDAWFQNKAKVKDFYTFQLDFSFHAPLYVEEAFDMKWMKFYEKWNIFPFELKFRNILCIRTAS